MAFFGFFGNKQPAQPVPGGETGVEISGIPAGVPPVAQPTTPDINTMGGLMPAAPAAEQPAVSGNLEETGTWAAAQAGLNAEKAAATPSATPTASTPPMGTFGVPPTPEAMASVQDMNPTKVSGEVAQSPVSAETPLVSSPIETPADQFSTPAPETTEMKTPDTGPSSEPAVENPAPIASPVAETVETPPPPPFSMDAITTPKIETPEPSTESTDGQNTPTNPSVTETPTVSVTPEPSLDTTPPPPIEPITPEVTAPKETPAPVSEVMSSVNTPPTSTEETPTNTELMPTNPPAEIPPPATASLQTPVSGALPEAPVETTPAVETEPTEPAQTDLPQAA